MMSPSRSLEKANRNRTRISIKELPPGPQLASKEHRSSQMHMEMEDDSTSVRSADTPDVKMSEQEQAAAARVPAAAVTPATPATLATPATPAAAKPLAPPPPAAKRPLEEEVTDRKPPAPKKEKGPAPPPPLESGGGSPPASPQRLAPAPAPAPAPANAKKPPAPRPPHPQTATTIVDQVCRDAEKAVEEKTEPRPEPKEPKAETKTEKPERPEEKNHVDAKPLPEPLKTLPMENKANSVENIVAIPLKKRDSKGPTDKIEKALENGGIDKRNSIHKTVSAERITVADKVINKSSSVETISIDKKPIEKAKEPSIDKKAPTEKKKEPERDVNIEIRSVSAEIERLERNSRSNSFDDKCVEVTRINTDVCVNRIDRFSRSSSLDKSEISIELERDRESDERRAKTVEIRPVSPYHSPSPPAVATVSEVSVSPVVVVVEPNSLAAAAHHVTVTTTHPPVLSTGAQLPPHAVTISTTPPIADEVVIVGAAGSASSDDDCFAPSSLDSLDCTASYTEKRGRRLDSSEVLILSAPAADSGVFDDSSHAVHTLDTSHVSVVTVGADEVRVRDSAVAPPPSLSPDSFDRRSASDSGSVGSAPRAGSDSPQRGDSRGNGGQRINTESPAPDPGQALENGEAVVLRRKSDQPHRIQRSKEDIHLANLKKKTRKRTRKFEIDGVMVTTTTSKVIWGDEASGRTWDDHALRKQELREIKMLQKQEQKQFQDLHAKELQLREQQDKRFEAELGSLSRAHEADLETLARAQRAAAERAEQALEAELRAAAKRLRADHERDLRHFRDTLKQELRLLKQEVELVNKERRKEAYRARRQRVDAEHSERERAFVAALADAGDALLRRIHENHRDRQALADQQYLQQRQQIMRTREAALCELEEKQIHERHQLAKRQLKDEFLLRRHQMLVRHDKELEQIKRKNTRKEEELAKCQALEKRSLPKRIRAEQKAREMMFRESLRISASGHDKHEDERERLKKFQENEKRRYRAEQQRLATKHAKAREELRAAGEALLRELEQYQNEKRKALMNHESNKMKAVEERYSQDLREWRATLGDRKAELDNQFAMQLEEQERQAESARLPPPASNMPQHSSALHSSRTSLASSHYE